MVDKPNAFYGQMIRGSIKNFSPTFVTWSADHVYGISIIGVVWVERALVKKGESDKNRNIIGSF